MSLTLGACAGASLFGPIGDNLSAPISIALDPTTNRAYIINSNLSVAFEDATLMVLDLTDPANPIILAITGNPISIPSLSGQVYYDATTQTIFTPNRFSENDTDVIDNLLQVEVAENADFGNTTLYDAGSNPYGIVCCATTNSAQEQLFVVAEGTLEIFERADPNNAISVSLAITLTNNNTLSGNSTTRGVIFGRQLYLSNRQGVIYIINLDKVADTSINPIDYLITDMEDLRGITTDGTYIYVAQQAYNSDDPNELLVIDPVAFPAVAAITPAVIEVGISDTNNGVTVQVTTATLGNEVTEIIVFGTMAYVANSDDNTVSIIDISDPTNIPTPTTVSVGDAPFGLAAATFGSQDLLYVSNLNSNDISIIDLSDNEVVGTFP